MSMFDDLELSQASEPTEEELLKEARAWGCDTIEEFDEMMDEAYGKFEEYNDKMRLWFYENLD